MNIAALFNNERSNRWNGRIQTHLLEVMKNKKNIWVSIKKEYLEGKVREEK